jgi:hypothetical protein
MSGETNDERLRNVARQHLASMTDIEPSAELRARIEAIPSTHPMPDHGGRDDSRRLRFVVPAIAGIAVAIAICALLVGALVVRPSVVGPSVSRTSTASALGPSASPTPVPSPSGGSAQSVDRYPGGIPKTYGGERVYLGFGAFIHGQQMADATPFLAGGWFGDGSREVCTGGAIQLGSPIPATFQHGCGSVIGADSPWAAYSLPASLGWIAWDGHSLPGGRGPAVIRVHTHDPRSAECSAATVSYCREMFIVDEVVWTGDSATEASPIGVTEAVARLDRLNIEESLPIGGTATLAVQRHIFPTFRPQTCAAPWPVATFDLQGDPRFGLLAVFPTQTARVEAEGTIALDGSCPVDSRIVRPGAAKWVGVQNVLVLAYGDDTADAVEAVMASQGDAVGVDTPQLDFPPSSLDESYAFLTYYLAARAAGNIDTASRYAGSSSSLDEVEGRYAANALTYVIGPATVPEQSQLPFSVLGSLQSEALPGTLRMFEVTHPDSTDTALRDETFICYELKNPQIDSWIVVRLAP